jgi:pilus assembly protein TadC
MGILSLGLLLRRFIFPSRFSLTDPTRQGHEDEEISREEQELLDEEADAIAQAIQKKKKRQRKEPTIEEQLFMAGRLSESERLDFHRKRKLAPLVFGGIGCIVGIVFGSWKALLLFAVFGTLLGFFIPLKILRGWVTSQHEEISYYLPLVIEQMAIGVSSSLDIGPCLSKIIEMADDRKTHNAVTKLLKYSLMYVKSGVSLEESLSEIGRSSGHPEYKHVVLALSQVAKFGGEISKQLQDLADSVASQREAKIEATIKKLEIKATGPVGLIFVAYMMIIFLGIVASALKNF